MCMTNSQKKLACLLLFKSQDFSIYQTYFSYLNKTGWLFPRIKIQDVNFSFCKTEKFIFLHRFCNEIYIKIFVLSKAIIKNINFVEMVWLKSSKYA